MGGIHIRTIHVGVTGHFMGTQSLSAWTGGGKAECVVRTFRRTLSSVKDANYPDVFAFVVADGKFQGAGARPSLLNQLDPLDSLCWCCTRTVLTTVTRQNRFWSPFLVTGTSLKGLFGCLAG